MGTVPIPIGDSYTTEVADPVSFPNDYAKETTAQDAKDAATTAAANAAAAAAIATDAATDAASLEARVPAVPATQAEVTAAKNKATDAEAEAIVAKLNAAAAAADAASLEARVPAVPATQAETTAAKLNAADAETAGLAAVTAAADAETEAIAAKVVAESIQGGQHGYAVRDSIAWLHVTGEPFAGTITGGGAYTGYRGLPCWSVPAGGVVQTPLVPRDTPGKPNLRWSGVIARGNVLNQIYFGMGVASAAQWGLTTRTRAVARIIAGTGVVDFETADMDAGTKQTSLGVVTINDTLFHTFEFLLTDVSVKFYIDGVLRATHAATIWPRGNTEIFPAFQMRDATATPSYLSRLVAKWEA